VAKISHRNAEKLLNIAPVRGGSHTTPEKEIYR
jgi:hypothetical protein